MKTWACRLSDFVFQFSMSQLALKWIGIAALAIIYSGPVCALPSQDEPDVDHTEAGYSESPTAVSWELMAADGIEPVFSSMENHSLTWQTHSVGFAGAGADRSDKGETATQYQSFDVWAWRVMRPVLPQSMYSGEAIGIRSRRVVLSPLEMDPTKFLADTYSKSASPNPFVSASKDMYQ